MKAKVSWVEGMTFMGRSQSGHNVVFDASGEGSAAPSPMEMVLMSAGACSSVDVVSILEKAKQKVAKVEVELSSERAETAPRVFKKIHLHFVVYGTEVSPKHVERAVNLSADKYCSVSIMLQGAVEVTHSFTVVEQSA